MFCFIPFSIMLITNCLLVYRISIGKKLTKTKTLEKSSKTTMTVLFVNSLFLIFAGPSALINAFFLDTMFEIDYGVFILFTSDNIIFTFNSIGFIILYFSNKQFAREAKSLYFKLIKRPNAIPDARFTRTNVTIKTDANI